MPKTTASQLWKECDVLICQFVKAENNGDHVLSRKLQIEANAKIQEAAQKQKEEENEAKNEKTLESPDAGQR